MRKKRLHIGFLILILLTAELPALTIKMGSLVPVGSPWDLNLRRLAAEWDTLSDKEIRLKIYSGGVAGGEADMLRKIRINQLQAAGLSPLGLSHIFSGVLAPAMPMLVETEDELKYLLRKMSPVFEEEFEKKGLKILCWNIIGWGYFFSRDPVVYPDDLQDQIFWVSDGNYQEAEAWRKLGYRAATFSAIDVLVQLHTGGVDAMLTAPLYTALNQWFSVTRHMTDLKWVPIYGALVISTKVWMKIPEKLRPQLETSAREFAVRMDDETRQANKEALSLMQKHGLIIHEVPEQAKREWKRLIDEGLSDFIGDKFDIKYLNMAKAYLAEYRRTKS